MSRANWVTASERIAAELREMGYDQALSMSIEELMVRLGTDVERPVYRDRGAWASIQRGTKDWDATRRAGLVVNFWPDETGRPVQHVTFR